VPVRPVEDKFSHWLSNKHTPTLEALFSAQTVNVLAWRNLELWNADVISVWQEAAERGTIQLTLDSPMDGRGRNACVSLQVDDADAYYREWSARVVLFFESRRTKTGEHKPLMSWTHLVTPLSL
jgi:hypothetical protein